jgi:phosphoribosyl 1,2-cyclic phosphodiesterase
MTPETNPVLTLSQTSMNIRMYDLNGEGDCFLLRFLDDDDVPRHILIDCGIFISTSNGKKRLTDVADDIATITNNHLDILVVTHEHWDHLIGFEYADEVFDNMMIDEVWLAWTENTAGDELAANLHKKYKDSGHREICGRQCPGGHADTRGAVV